LSLISLELITLWPLTNFLQTCKTCTGLAA
jgi:hypothetical protein